MMNQEVYQVSFSFKRTLSDSCYIGIPKGLTDEERDMFIKGYLSNLYDFTFYENITLTLRNVTDEFES